MAAGVLAPGLHSVHHMSPIDFAGNFLCTDELTTNGKIDRQFGQTENWLGRMWKDFVLPLDIRDGADFL